MKEPLVEFKNVSKSYRLAATSVRQDGRPTGFLAKLVRRFRTESFSAVESTSLSFFRGEAVGLVGKNGSGKSTLMGLAAGNLKPEKGSVEVKGRVAPLLELGAGFHPDLTGRENIKLNAVILGMTRAELKDKMAQIIEFAELGSFIDQPLRVYSSGMTARLGFSVAAFLEADIILIDELLGVGDLRYREKCFDKLHEFTRAGKLILFVSHNLESLQKLCTRIVVLHERKPAFDGKTTEGLAFYKKLTAP